ncbi:hypothetical protein [Rhizobium jaguaris]|uniref:hypothetical protein n=1 Tax=Rhizobium jaguaris TaxID=1312183 RepID=UPI0013C4A3DD|nr:hypothetical protein [Rhizobium jaguaris]
MAIIIELIKFLGTLTSTLAAIAGAYLDGTKTVDSGRLTLKGWLVVCAAGAGLFLAGAAQVFQFTVDAATAAKINAQNTKTALRLAGLSYPLEPIQLVFTEEFPMDQEALRDYVQTARELAQRFTRPSILFLATPNLMRLQRETTYFSLSLLRST